MGSLDGWLNRGLDHSPATMATGITHRFLRRSGVAHPAYTLALCAWVGRCADRGSGRFSCLALNSSPCRSEPVLLGLALQVGEDLFGNQPVSFRVRMSVVLEE
jgi:hypothetical protein